MMTSLLIVNSFSKVLSLHLFVYLSICRVNGSLKPRRPTKGTLLRLPWFQLRNRHRHQSAMGEDMNQRGKKKMSDFTSEVIYREANV